MSLTPEQRAKMEAYGAIATPPKWISVDERLPANETVLAFNPDTEITLSLYTSGKWFYEDGSLRHGVTHWMPLPEPPK